MANSIYLPTRPIWRDTGTTSTTPAVVYIPPGVRQLKLWVDALSYVSFGDAFTAPSVTLANEVYTITTSGNPESGVFTLKFGGQETGNLTFDESAADVITALEALSNVASGDLVGGGGALPTAITVTGAQVYAGVGAMPLLELGSSTMVAGGIQYLLLGISWTVTPPTVNVPSVQVRRSTHGTGMNNTAGGYAYIEADTQEVFDIANSPSRAGGATASARYLYIATVASTGNYRASGYLLA